MSTEIVVNAEIRSKTILMATLKEMGLHFQEIGQNEISIGGSYHATKINCETGDIRFDDMNQNNVDKIIQNYMKEFWRDKAIQEGCQIEETVDSKGTIHMKLSR